MWSFKKNIYRTRREDEVICPDCIAHDVIIGTQTWTACNSVVPTYRDGTTIPYQVNSTLWSMLTTGAWCYVNNDPATELKYGKLYNWYAVAGIYDAASLANPALRKEFAPTGYHVPTDAEWTILSNELGGDTISGGELKQTGLCNWQTPNTGATDSSGFRAIPIGWRDEYGTLYPSQEYSYHWASTLYSLVFPLAFARRLSYNSDNFDIMAGDFKAGYPVRFIKDEVVCPDVTIGTQVWTSCNLNVDRYRDGTYIPEVTDPVAWANLTTGAWCHYNNDPLNEPIYGKLYNWFAVTDTLHGGIAPIGYHVPSYSEFTNAVNALGGYLIAGGKLKETGTAHWSFPNTSASNLSGFTGLPGGYRDIIYGAVFNDINNSGYYWSTTEAYSPGVTGTAWGYALGYNTNQAGSFYIHKRDACSVRLIQD